MGERYQLEWETVSTSREEYQTEAHKASGLPAAPAVMIEGELVHQGPGVSEEKLEAAIRQHLGLVQP